jgi:hypothetical protein
MLPVPHPPFPHGHWPSSQSLVLILCSLAVPLKVDNAFWLFCYVPYSSLTQQARLRALRVDEEFVINTQGGLTAKGLDRSSEKSISLADWIAVAAVAVECTTKYHGTDRGQSLAAHHHIVEGLAVSHNLTVAMEYDIQQCEAVAANPSHDLSGLDVLALTIITTCLVTTASLPSAPSPSPNKCPSPFSPSSSSSPQKKPRSMDFSGGSCFCCGQSGHLPADCIATTTITGRPVLALASNAKSKHALLHPSRKTFCFDWARSTSCQFGDSCTNFHGCSVCGASGHGAHTCIHSG